MYVCIAACAWCDENPSTVSHGSILAYSKERSTKRRYVEGEVWPRSWVTKDETAPKEGWSSVSGNTCTKCFTRLFPPPPPWLSLCLSPSASVRLFACMSAARWSIMPVIAASATEKVVVDVCRSRCRAVEAVHDADHADESSSANGNAVEAKADAEDEEKAEEEEEEAFGYANSNTSNSSSSACFGLPLLSVSTFSAAFSFPPCTVTDTTTVLPSAAEAYVEDSGTW